jgi:hypothetical protein
MRHALTLDAFVQRLKAKKLTDKRCGGDLSHPLEFMSLKPVLSNHNVSDLDKNGGEDMV